MAIELSGLFLDPGQELRRDRPRPPELRQDDYDQLFDFSTVFYDCFATADGRHVVCVGPPLSNLTDAVVAAVVRPIEHSLKSAADIRHLTRHSQIWLQTDKHQLEIDGDIFRPRVLSVQPNECELFRDKRVLLTVSKDNELVWIRDWVEFHVANHGCNAVAFYDNNSSRYGVEEIHAAISAVPGIEAVVVVPWPYLWGPCGHGVKNWDSDFCQYGVLEQARWRFLAHAEAVINADVDELVVTQNGESVFDLVKKSRTGFLRYNGVWIESVSKSVGSNCWRHKDFVYRDPAVGPAERKWVIMPSRCDLRAQWRVHGVADTEPPDLDLSAAVAHRHFRAITTGWQRRSWTLQEPDQRHQLDADLVRAFSTAAIARGPEGMSAR